MSLYYNQIQMSFVKHLLMHIDKTKLNCKNRIIIPKDIKVLRNSNSVKHTQNTRLSHSYSQFLNNSKHSLILAIFNSSILLSIEYY